MLPEVRRRDGGLARRRPGRARPRRPGPGGGDRPGADRGRRRLPGAARRLRRGRDDPGPAGDGRAALRGVRACSPARPRWTRSSPRSCSPRPGCPRATTWCSATRPVRCAPIPTCWTRRRASGWGCPVFVKPSRAGSSIGITKVTDWAQFPEAVATAAAVDPKVIVEASVPGREVECGVLAGAGRRPAGGEPARPRSGCGPASTGTTSRPSTSTTRWTSTSRPTSPPSRPRPCRRRPGGPTWPWTAGAWRGSTSSSARTPTAATGWSSTRSTRCPASRRSRCSRGCGRPAA